MSELLELLLQILLEVLPYCIDFDAVWRFSLATVGGVLTAVLVAWRFPGRPVPVWLGCILAGVASGLWWEYRSRRG